MAKTVDILRYVLGLDARQFRKEAKRVDKDVDKLSGTVGKSSSVFGKFSKVIGIVGAALATLKLGGLIKDATLVAARIEVLKNVLELTGKAAGKTSAELEFNTQKLVSLGIAEQEALQIGLRFIQVQLDLADSLKIARAAQDLAVVAGQDSSATAVALTDAIVKQEPSLLRQFGIIANLNEIYKDLSISLGKTAAELTQSERRQAFLNIILEKAKTVAGSYEKAMELVGKRLTSLPRFFQNAQKAVGQHFLPAMRDAIDATTDFLKGITALFETKGQQFTRQIFAFAKGFEKFSASLPKIRELAKEFDTLTKIQSRTAPQQARLNQVIQELGDLLPGVRTVLQGYTSDLDGTKIALDALIERSVELERLKLVAALDAQAEAFKRNTDRIKDLRETARTGSGRQGFVAANIEADTKRVKEFTAALKAIAEERELLAARLANLRRDGGRGDTAIEDRLKQLDRQQRIATEGLAAAGQAVAKYKAEILELENANEQLVETLARLFPNIKENIILVALLSGKYQKLLDDVAAVQRKIAEGIVKPPVFTSNAELLAKGRAALADKEAVDRAERLAGFNKRRAENAAVVAKLAKKAGEDEKKRLVLTKRRATQQRNTVEDMEREEGLAESLIDKQERLVRILDLAALGIGKINQEMGNLVQSAADFANALATGDIFSKIGAGINLVSDIIGGIGSLFGGGGDRAEEKAERDRELLEQQKELVRANEEVRQAIDRWIANINSRNIGELKSIASLALLFQNLLRDAPDLNFDQFERRFDDLVGSLEGLGLELPPELSDALSVFNDIKDGLNLEGPFRDLNSLLDQIRRASLLPQAQLNDAINADTLAKMLFTLKKMQDNGTLDLARGQELIDFWKSFQDLSLTQEKDLLDSLLDLLRSGGNIDPSGVLDLLAAIESLEEAIQAEADALAALPPSIAAAATESDTLEKMLAALRSLDDSGDLTFSLGEQLIAFWKNFQDLSLTQEETLLQDLLKRLKENGLIDEDGLLALLLQIETLQDAIKDQAEKEEAEGLTQIQRSVTTITEAQANIISATLNSILGVLGLMDTKLASLVTLFSGIEPGGLLSGGATRRPLVATPSFGFELPGILASIRGVEEKLGSFLDRVAAQTGPLVSVSPGGIVIHQSFPGVRSTKAIENVSAKAITEALVSEGRARGIQV